MQHDIKREKIEKIEKKKKSALQTALYAMLALLTILATCAAAYIGLSAVYGGLFLPSFMSGLSVLALGIIGIATLASLAAVTFGRALWRPKEIQPDGTEKSVGSVGARLAIAAPVVIIAAAAVYAGMSVVAPDVFKVPSFIEAMPDSTIMIIAVSILAAVTALSMLKILLTDNTKHPAHTQDTNTSRINIGGITKEPDGKNATHIINLTQGLPNNARIRFDYSSNKDVATINIETKPIAEKATHKEAAASYRK